MRTVVAAIDGGLATRPVLACARAVGRMLHANVVAVYVRTDGVGAQRTFAMRAGLPLRVLAGPVLDRLVEVGADRGVVALVIGARGLATDPRALGSTATAVATRVPKPVVVVAPDAEPRTEFKRVLVPLEGTTATSLAARSLVELGPGRELDVVALHVLEPDNIPSFVDQPQHWHAGWVREFLARFCPWGIDEVDMQIRIGRREQVIAETARESGCDLIALGWSRDLSDDHARAVRETLRLSSLPVALIPVRRDVPAGAAVVAAAPRERSSDRGTRGPVRS